MMWIQLRQMVRIRVEVVTKDDTSCPMYCLTCKAGVLDTLYHPSHMTTTIESTSDFLVLKMLFMSGQDFQGSKKGKL